MAAADARRTAAWLAIAGAVTALSVAPSALGGQPSTDRPNIVLIITDDLGAADIGV